jgi:hypothetical protein
MSYCAFENTLQDLYQIRDILREARSWEELTKEASDYEIRAMKDMPSVLKDISNMIKELKESSY